MVLDRCELLIEKQFMSEEGKVKNTTQLVAVFDKIKEKLKQIIIKDTNNAVRDSGVSLLATIRIILDHNPGTVQEVINTLPKYRINEINFRLDTYKQNLGGDAPVTDREYQASQVSARSGNANRGKSQEK